MGGPQDFRDQVWGLRARWGGDQARLREAAAQGLVVIAVELEQNGACALRAAAATAACRARGGRGNQVLDAAPVSQPRRAQRVAAQALLSRSRSW